LEKRLWGPTKAKGDQLARKEVVRKKAGRAVGRKNLRYAPVKGPRKYRRERDFWSNKGNRTNRHLSGGHLREMKMYLKKKSSGLKVKVHLVGIHGGGGSPGGFQFCGPANTKNESDTSMIEPCGIKNLQGGEKNKLFRNSGKRKGVEKTWVGDGPGPIVEGGPWGKKSWGP